MSFVTHDSSIQPQLPQILLGNEHQFTKKLMVEIAETKPNNFYVWRCESAWNNHRTMRRALTVLHACLKKHLDTHQPILVLDVVGSHYHRSISLYARRLGLRLMYVPAKMTPYLQPADTHVFSKLKSAVRSMWVQARSENGGADVLMKQLLSIVFQASRKVLCRNSWHRAFEEVGLLCSQVRLSQKLLWVLQWDAPPQVPSTQPTPKQLETVCPKRTKVSELSLFSKAPPKGAPGGKPIVLEEDATPPGSYKPAGGSSPPISTRTRSKVTHPSGEAASKTKGKGKGSLCAGGGDATA